MPSDPLTPIVLEALMSAYKPTYAQNGLGLNPYDVTRARLDLARQHHMLLIQAAIADGVPAVELAHDIAAFASAAAQLLELCSQPTGQAPMILKVL